jgi:hypothetical protein
MRSSRLLPDHPDRHAYMAARVPREQLGYEFDDRRHARGAG